MDIFFRVVCLQQPYSAVDIIADSSRRDDPFFQVKSGHSPDRKTVPLMSVGHHISRFQDPWQAGHISGLLKSSIALHTFEKLRRCVDHCGDPHVPGFGDFPGVIINPF